MKFYCTFGQSHIHKFNDIILDKDIVLEIEANSRDEVFEIMNRYFGNKWSMLYDKIPSMIYYPRGIIKFPF